MHFKTSAFVLAALSFEGALARPSLNHRHLHVRDAVTVEERQIGGSWDNAANYAGVNWATVDYSGGAKATAAASAAEPSAAAPTGEVVAADFKAPSSAASSVSASAPAPSASASASSSSGSGSESTSGGFSLQGFGASTTPKSNGNVDQYIGNVGSPYGSNIQQVDNAGSYEYTASFTSTSESPRTIVIWNKCGSDGQANSGQSSPAAMTFTLAPKGTTTVAFAPNSQGAWCDFTNGKMNPVDGARECAYGEFDFGNTSNGGYSGFDVSKIQASSVGAGCNMHISGAGQTSTCDTNSYDVEEAAIGGIGGNVAPGPLALKVTLGDF